MSAPKDIKNLTYAKAARLISYDPLTGDLRWKVAHKGIPVGSIAGSIGRDGYRTIWIGRAYKGHRLAWLLYTGTWPKKEIDHINRNRSDNRISNLKESTHSQNQINSNMYRNNKSGYRCVYPHKATKKYAAQVKRNGKTKHLGVFPTPHEAHAAVKAYLEGNSQ